jgi:hypothetical protein
MLHAYVEAEKKKTVKLTGTLITILGEKWIYSAD